MYSKQGLNIHWAPEDKLDIKQQQTDGTSSSRGQAGHQEAEDGHQAAANRRYISSRGQAGHQEAEDRRESKKLRTGGTSRRWGQAGHQEAEDRWNIKELRTGGTSRSRGQAGHQEAEDRREKDKVTQICRKILFPSGAAWALEDTRHAAEIQT